MCDTAVISSQINMLSRRSYDRRLRLAQSREQRHVRSLQQLNRQIEALNDTLRAQWHDITEAEYSQLAPQLTLLESTLQGLLQDIQRLSAGVHTYDAVVERLQDATTDLEEIDSDIRNLRIALPRHPDYATLIAQASALA